MTFLFIHKKNIVTIFLAVYFILGFCGHIYCCREPYGKIAGKITDKVTGLPIAGAYLEGSGYTISNKDGTYQHGAGVWVKKFQVFADGYNDYEFEQQLIENETVIYDIEMIPGQNTTILPTTATIKGVITISLSGVEIPLTNVSIWLGNSFNGLGFSSRTNDDGRYLMQVIPGNYLMGVSLSAGSYIDTYFDISDNETLYKNISVDSNSRRFILHRH